MTGGTRKEEPYSYLHSTIRPGCLGSGKYQGTNDLLQGADGLQMAVPFLQGLPEFIPHTLKLFLFALQSKGHLKSLPCKAFILPHRASPILVPVTAQIKALGLEVPSVPRHAVADTAGGPHLGSAAAAAAIPER